MNVTPEEAVRKYCAFMLQPFAPSSGMCAGPNCMAWMWSEPEFEHRDTDNIDRSKGVTEERPTGELPKRPDGDGWEPDGECFEIGYHKSSARKAEFGPGLRQRWKRKREQQRGFCGRVRSYF